MLILTRKPQEAIVINDNVKVMVLQVKGNQVRIGINAPKAVSVHRIEVYEKIKEEQQLKDGY